jgi:hypothetical protein
MKRTATIVGAVVAAAIGVATPAAAHTDSDLVAVPAGSASTVTLKPTHGCGDSPTVAVRIRAPFPDATAGDVDGWTATATADGAGNTVLEWTGGVLPADEDGAFPVAFTAPPTPGVLLTFPAIQVCENGEELAWISGDPADEFPAPRVLVLPAGAEPAATRDDVPLDAPGREQLVALVDVDNPQATTTTTAAPTSTTTAAPTTTVAAPTTTAAAPTTTGAPAGTAASSTEPASTTTDADDGGGSSAAPIVIAVVVAAAIAAGAIALLRRRGG